MNSVDLYIKRNLDHEIERYFCVNKGRDLTNIVHEISCLNEKDFKQMLKEISHFKLWLPESEQSFFNHEEIFYTAFMRLGSTTLFNKFLGELSQQKLQCAIDEREMVKFDYKNEEFVVAQKEFLQYLFGPRL